MSEHIVHPRVYLLICALLLGLTALTVWVAFADLGWLNLFAALLIAFTKATLVVLYFMHVRWSPKLIPAVIVAGVLWVGILLALLLSDYLSRGWMSAAGA